MVVDNFSLVIFRACNFLPCFDYLWFLLWGVGIGGESYSRTHTCILRLIGCFLLVYSMGCLSDSCTYTLMRNTKTKFLFCCTRRKFVDY
jgi:hypothetical protein